MVIVEGGRKGVKKFIRLMLHRINWDLSDEKKISLDDENNDKDNNSDSENEFTEEGTIKSSKGENRCDLLWQGLVPKRIFHSFRFQVIFYYFKMFYLI
jgi:U4/U6 small nuclear ribonucleoprotein PRP3